MSISDIYREFDPNLDLPVDLKGVTVAVNDTTESEIPDPDTEIDIQDETDEDDASDLNEDDPNDVLDPPGYMEIILPMVVHIGPDGSQVVDVTVEVEDIEQAIDYQVRITKA